MDLIYQFMEAEDIRERSEERDIYAADNLDALADNDEISAEEEAFMYGYLNS